MATETSESEPRIAIWSLPARVIGVYFIAYLVQYIPSVAFEAYTYQRADGEMLARTVIEIIKSSGPIGLGSATNALAAAMIAEAIMVLASMINKRQRARGHAEGLKEGRAQGVKEGIELGVQEGHAQGVKQAAKRSNANLRALAKKYDIPEEDLPFLDEDAGNA